METSSYNNLIRSLNTPDKPVQAKVTGNIPDWLNGTLYRNGPGKYEFGDKAYFHLFDGQACVHKYTISKGQVTYFSKLLETRMYKKACEDANLPPMFGTADLCASVFDRFKAVFVTGKVRSTIDNTNVNVVPYCNEHLYALTETSMMCRIDPENLSIMDTINVTRILPTASTTIAHPHVERDGSWINVGLNATSMLYPRYEFVRYQGGKEEVKAKNCVENGSVIASVPSSRLSGISYFHSFGLSENYIIFFEQSMLLNFANFMRIYLTRNAPLSEAYYHDPNFKTIIHIIDKRTGAIVAQKYETDPLFVFHHINAYETSTRNEQTGRDDISLVVDVCAYDAKHFNILRLNYNEMFSEKNSGADCVKATACRVVIPLREDTTLSEPTPVFCKLKQLNENVSFELPIINYEKNNGLKYKYVFGVSFYEAPYPVVKINVDDPTDVKMKSYSQNGAKELPSEPVFVPNPNGESEDDGVLLVMIVSEKNDYLSILDAKTLDEIATAELPSNVKGALTFHGCFTDQNAFKGVNQ